MSKLQRLSSLLALILFISCADAKPSKSYSSGGGFKSSPSAGKSYSGSSSSSSKSYSSGSSGKSYSSGTTTTSTTKASGKSYSSGTTTTASSNKTSGKSYSAGGISTTTTSSSKPTKSTYDSAALKEHKSVESRAAYKSTFQKSEAPKTEYKTAKGESVKIDPKDRKIDSLRNQLDNQKWANRELRQQQFYSNYYSHPVSLFPVGVYYHDPYNDFFFMWLWSQSMETRSLWLYNHQASLDQARYNALLAKDAQLQAQINNLKTQHAPVDPTYAPKGVEQDLMYNDSYVDAAYNPSGHPVASSDSGLGWLCSGFFTLLVIVAVCFGVYYLVFVHRF